jgi:hypothetical protein
LNTETSVAQSCAPTHNKKRFVIPAGIEVCLDNSTHNRIAEIGFWSWFREACDAQEERFAVKARHGDTKLFLAEVKSVLRKTCEVCGRKFSSERASRKTCSARCKKRRQRRTV